MSASKTSTENDATEKKIPSTKEVVPDVRKKALQGCRVVFSGLFPSEGASEERNRAMALVQSFGAIVQPEILTKDDNPEVYTTHVVAAKEGTAKVTKARKTR